MKKTILILTVLMNISYAQNKGDFSKPEGLIDILAESCYILFDYAICPETKKIGKGGKFGGINWMAHGYFEDKNINFETTTLYIIGNRVFFSETLDDKLLETARSTVVFLDKEIKYTQNGKAYSIPTAALKIPVKILELDKMNN